MKKALTVLAAATMVFGSTAAHAVTRPEPTDFNKPVVEESELGASEDGTLVLIGLGITGLIGILLAAASSNGNSPR